MMLSLDSFVFSLQSAPFKEMQRQRNWKHRTSSRNGTRDASQFTGPGDDTFTLNGMVAESNGVGKRASLDDLEKLADAGDAYALVDGTGRVYGAYIIESLNETATYHTAEGIARKIEFNLTLKRVPDDSIAAKLADGKQTESASQSALNDLKAVTTTATNVINNVRNLSINSLKSAAIEFTATMAPGAMNSAIKGLSDANGMGLAKAISTARQVSELNGDAVGSVVNYVLGKTNADATAAPASGNAS